MNPTKLYRAFFKRKKASSPTGKEGVESRAAHAIYSGVQKALRAVADSLDGVPAPGLQGAIKGILFIMDNIDRASQNLDDFQQLQGYLESCEGIFTTYKAESLPPAVKEAMLTLTDKIRVSSQVIAQIVDRGRARRIWESSEDAQTFITHVRSINAALARFQIATSTFTAIQSSQTLAINRQLLIDKIANVEGAHYNARERDHVSPCLENTRTATIKSITEWMHDVYGPPIFWLYGLAGMGKSTVAQSIAEHCARNDILAGHFFFSRDKQTRFTADGLFTTIAHQLCAFEIRLVPHLAAAVLKDASLSGARNTYLFPRLIVRPFLQLRNEVPGLLFPMVVVIDALDECQGLRDATEVLSLLLKNDLCLRPRPVLKLLVTSRPESHIRKVFDESDPNDPTRGFVAYDLGSDDARDDIELYLKKGFRDIQASRPECFKSRKSPWPELYILKKLLHRSAGLFIYASTTLKFVGDPRQHPIKQLRLVSAANSNQTTVYSELDALYRQIIIQDPNLNRVHAILGAIILVFDPLSSKQLEILLELEEGDTYTTIQWLYSILFIPSDDDQPIRLFHPSFHDFLTNKERSGDLFLDTGIQHAKLAQACIKVIQTGWPSWRSHSNAHARLLKYACQYWPFHLSRADLTNSTILINQTEFVRSSIATWFDALLHLDLLNEAVGASSEIFRSTLLHEREDLCRHLCNKMMEFGALIARKYQHVRNVVPLYVAERLCQLAAGNSPDDPHYNHHLGVIRRKIHQWYPLAGSLPSAITSHETALRALPQDHEDRAVFLIEFAICRRLHYVRSRDPQHIQQCISLLEEALVIMSDSDTNKSICSNSYGLALVSRYDILKNAEDLQSAVEHYKRALTLPLTHPSNTPIFLYNLGLALHKSFAETNRRSDVEEAIRVLHEASTHPCAPPSVAFRAAYNRASCEDTLALESSLDAYHHALSLASCVSWTALRDNEARKLHKTAESCALEAAAKALSVNKVWIAVECAEQAGFTFWIGGLGIRSPFFPLGDEQSRAYDIAKILEVEGAEEPMGVLRSLTERGSPTQSIDALVREYKLLTSGLSRTDRTGRRMQSLFKHTNGFLPSGLLILLTGDLSNCDAIIIHPPPQDVTHIQLTASTDEILGLGRKSKDFWNYGTDEAVGKQILQQIWDLIVKPVLNSLKLEPKDDPLRSWWCPTGPFMDLPLHAASDYNSQPPLHLTDYMISSYLPMPSSFETLSKTAIRNPPSTKTDAPDTLLFLDPLEGRWDRPATKEIQELKQTIPETHFTMMGSTPSTLQHVLEKLRTCTGVHIAARAEQRNEDPADCRFVLPGEKHLQLSDLLSEPKLPNFAYLSTYPETAAWAAGPVTCRLGYDLLSVGFTSVVARQSPLSEEEAAIMATHFYTELIKINANLDFSNAAKALHLATVKLRAEGRSPSKLWVRFIHVGI